MLDNLQLGLLLFALAVLATCALVFLACGVAVVYLQPAWLRRKATAPGGVPPPGTPTDATPTHTTHPDTEEAMRRKKEEEQAARDEAAGGRGETCVSRDQVREVVEAQLRPVVSQLLEIKNMLPEQQTGRRDGGGDETKPPSEELKLLRAIHAQLETTVARWAEEVSRLPALFVATLRQHEQAEKEAAKARRQSEAERRAREEERRAREEDESRRESQQADFRKRFEAVTRESDMYGIAALVKELADDLQAATASQPASAETLPPYLNFVSKVEAVAGTLSDFNGRADHRPDGAALAAALDDLENASEILRGWHNASWLIGLLEEAGRQPSLRDKADRLKQLLNLEDVSVELDTEVGPRELKCLQVEGYVGSGPHPFVHEVVEGGYRLKDSKTVVKQPKVIIRMEN
jgi:hypothetical protein